MDRISHEECEKGLLHIFDTSDVFIILEVSRLCKGNPCKSCPALASHIYEQMHKIHPSVAGAGAKLTGVFQPDFGSGSKVGGQVAGGVLPGAECSSVAADPMASQQPSLLHVAASSTTELVELVLTDVFSS